jgi:hypothetical protein
MSSPIGSLSNGTGVPQIDALTRKYSLRQKSSFRGFPSNYPKAKQPR